MSKPEALSDKPITGGSVAFHKLPEEKDDPETSALIGGLLRQGYKVITGSTREPNTTEDKTTGKPDIPTPGG